MSSPWSSASVTVDRPPRGGGQQTKFSFAAQSMSFTQSWGAQPASGQVVYVARSAYPVVVVGSALELACYGRQFWGVVKSGPAILTRNDGTVEGLPTRRSSGGNEQVIEFADYREYLSADQVFCAFNLLDKRTIRGATGRWRRVRRYRHLLPGNWRFWMWTYSLRPFSAAQIIREILSYNVFNPAVARWATVGSPWSWAFHPDLENFPVLNIDAQDGRNLDEVLLEISEKLGLMFTLQGGPFTLQWARRGEGLLPDFDGDGQPDAFPIDAQGRIRADNAELKMVLSGNPTRIFVVGDRNLYLVLNLGLGCDWNRAWEEFLGGVDNLMADLFERGADPVTGQPYKSTNPDPVRREIENMAGGQLAAARARVITVREYAALRSDKDFTDYRKFQGRARMDIPAALYIEQIVFRAFRPPSVIKIGESSVPLSALHMVDDMPARVYHVPADPKGAMLYDLTESAAGNGYCIARGFRVDPAMFASVPSERFDPVTFYDALSVWSPISFQIDDSGEDGGFVILDEPVLRLDDIVLTDQTPGMEWLGGYPVFNANPTLRLADVRAALVFEGDPFRVPVTLPGTIIDPNNATRDATVREGGLRAEVVVNGETGLVLGEIPYADGFTAAQKAADVAIPLLRRPYSYLQGAYTWPLRNEEIPPALSGMINRLTLEYSDNGHDVRVEFAAERPVRNYQPERDYDRIRRGQQLLPRQQEYLDQARLFRATGVALRQSPSAIAQLSLLFRRIAGSPEGGQRQVTFNASGQLNVGTPVRKAPNTRAAYEPVPQANRYNRIVETEAVLPSVATAEHREFLGVTLRHNESTAHSVWVQDVGSALVRVKGPASFGDNLQLTGEDEITADYLVRQTGAGQVVGRLAEEEIPDGVVRLAKVQLGGGGGGGGDLEFHWL